MHPSTIDPQALRTATPQQHLSFQSAFGVSRFRAPTHELAYKPFGPPLATPSAVQSQRLGSLQNRLFGYQLQPAFPGAVFHSSSRFNPANTCEEQREEIRPSEQVRRRLEGIYEVDGEDDNVPVMILE